MNWIDSIVPWTITKQNKLFDYSRILLGVFIVYMGVFLALNMHELIHPLNMILGEPISDSEEIFTQNLFKLQEISQNVMVIVFMFLSIYIIISHIIGGLFLALGLFTRWVCLIQLPILLGATFLVNFPKGFTSPDNAIELITSVVILIGLLYFLVQGGSSKSLHELKRRIT